MNPAALVLLWIRLSVTLGYPAALTGLRSMTRAFAEQPPLVDTSERTNTYNADKIYRPTGGKLNIPANWYRPAEISSHADSSEPIIISIVRVSSTSVVKQRRLERVTKSVNSNFNVAAEFKGRIGEEEEEEEEEEEAKPAYSYDATPFVSLLRRHRLNVDENGPAESAEASSVITTTTTTTYTKPNSDPAGEHWPPATEEVYTSSVNESTSTLPDTTTDAAADQFADFYTETYPTSRKDVGLADTSWAASYDQSYPTPERVYGEPEKIYGEPEKVYGEPEKVYGEPEKVYGEPEKAYDEAEKHETADAENLKYKTESVHQDPETEFLKHDNHFDLPDATRNAQRVDPNSYSLFTTRVSDKKSSFIVDNGTHRKYRVEEKTPDGFIVGEYGMVNHRDGSLRGVRYTADSNINPSIIYETLVKFLSLK